MSGRIGRYFVLACILAAIWLASLPANANWLTTLVREGGEVGAVSAGRVARELGPVGRAASHLAGLKLAPKGALAAHATPEGHWQFVNREGQTFTVGTSEEMARVLPTLAPHALPGGSQKMTLYLSEDSVFANRSALDQIPRDADLFVVAEAGAAIPVTRAGNGSSLTLTAQVRPDIKTVLTDRDMFDELTFQLGRNFNKSNVRTISFDPAGAKFVSSAPKFEDGSKLALPDVLDPSAIKDGLKSIRGQTAVVTGRVDNGQLIVGPSGSPEISIPIEELLQAAQRSDVNLVILQSDVTRQAGNRNWLWQKISVDGLSSASDAVQLGDFLEGLAKRRGGFEVVASREGLGRVQISVIPSEAGIVEETTNTLRDVASHVTGEVVTKALSLHVRDQYEEKERDARLVPGIPSYYQIPYLIALFFGLVSWDYTRAWWRKLWPWAGPAVPESPRWLRGIRRFLSELVFLAVFVPIVGFPAFVALSAVRTFESVMAPFRWFKRRFLTSKV